MNPKIIILITLILVGCDKAEEQAAIPETPGKITVISEQEVPKDEKHSQFIGYDAKGERIIRYAPGGEETVESKNVAPHIVVRNLPYASVYRSLRMKKLSKNFIVKCSACHDDYANGVIGPSLLNLSGDEVYEMIVKYKTDRVKNIPMRELVRKMDDEEIRLIANDIAEFNKEIREEAGK
ncbi:MAG: hypothetical protein LBS40_00355 [Burkholderiales bacterium]|jgi:cytochrome c553|nr:hypothetical protein [Burkholderiales bacterium]